MVLTLALIHVPQVQAPSLPIRGLHAIRKGLKRSDDHADEQGPEADGGGPVRRRLRVKSPAPSNVARDRILVQCSVVYMIPMFPMTSIEQKNPGFSFVGHSIRPCGIDV